MTGTWELFAWLTSHRKTFTESVNARSSRQNYSNLNCCPEKGYNWPFILVSSILKKAVASFSTGVVIWSM